MNKSKLVFTLCLLVGAAAFAQVFLGNMFRLGSTTTAARPTSSSTIEGAVVYDTDLNKPIFNDGTQWVEFVTGSSGFWYDGGTDYLSNKGYIFAREAIKNPDAGTALKLYQEWAFNSPASTVQQLVISGSDTLAAGLPGQGGRIVFTNAGGTRYSAIYGGSGSGVNPFGASNGITLEGSEFMVTDLDRANRRILLNSTNELKSFASSGNNAYAVNTNGARYDRGSGTDDYDISDGTGIETPGYYESTRAFSSGAGLIANRVQAAGGAASAFTSGAATAAGVGTLSWNSTRNQMYTQVSSSAFAPIGQPHLVADKQTITTRVFGGTAANAPPQIAEQVVVGGAGTDTLQSYWTSTSGNSTTITTSPYRAYYALTTTSSDANRQYWTVASSAASTTMLPITSTDASPQFCTRVVIFTLATNMRVFAGWVASLPSGGTATLSATGAVFRYDTSVNTKWSLCTRDSTTQSCTDTSITVAADTDYLLCITMDSSRNVYGWVNGVHEASQTANLPVTNTKIAPFISAENISGGAGKTLLVGVTQAEIQ